MKEEQEVTFTITLPIKHAYTFIDEMCRQSILVFNKIKNIDDLEGKRKAAECAERLANLADRLADELSKEEAKQKSLPDQPVRRTIYDLKNM